MLLYFHVSHIITQQSGHFVVVIVLQFGKGSRCLACADSNTNDMDKGESHRTAVFRKKALKSNNGV